MPVPTPAATPSTVPTPAATPAATPAVPRLTVRGFPEHSRPTEYAPSGTMSHSRIDNSVAAIRDDPTPNPAVAEAVARVRAAIRDKHVNAFSVIDILAAVCDAGISWTVAEDVLVEIAMGADGLAGTADDLIPPGTVRAIKSLLKLGIVRDLASWMWNTKPSTTTAQRRNRFWCL